MPASYVGMVGTLAQTGTTTATTVVIPVTRACAAGNVVIAWVRPQGGVRNTTGVADSRGNPWRIDLMATNNSQAAQGNNPIAVCSGVMVDPLQVGDTITVTFQSTAQYRAGAAAEYAGLSVVGNGAVLAESVWVPGTTTSAAADLATPAPAGDLVLGFGASNGTGTVSTTTADALSGQAFTNVNAPSGGYLNAGRKIVAAGGSLHRATFTVASGAVSAGIFRYAATPATGTPFNANTLETGLAPGTAITTGNSGGGQAGNAFQLVTATGGFPAYASGAAEGALCAEIRNNPAGAQVSLGWGDFTGRLVFYYRLYLRLEALPAAQFRLMWNGTASTAVSALFLSTAGAPVAYGTGGVGMTSGGTPPWVLPIGSWFRLEGRVNVAAAPDGRHDLRVFTGANLHGVSPDLANSAVGNTGTAAITRHYAGITAAGQVMSYGLFMDAMAIADDGWIGPAAVPAPGPTARAWNGSAWVPAAAVRSWAGSAWVPSRVWDGSAWVPLA